MQGLELIKNITQGRKDNYRGQCDALFQPLAQALSQVQPEDGLGGAAVSVYFQGKQVAELYTGDANQGEQWTAQNMALSYSTGKAVLATLAHILVSEGFLDYDTPVAQYWAAFAQNGKEQITLRHLLNHQSGLYDIRHHISDATQMRDWQGMLQVYEQMPPDFVTGTATAYQALNFGWLVGGVIEKVMQQPLTQVFNQYLVQPLALDGAYFGVPTDQLYRVARPILKPKSQHAQTKVQKPRPPLAANGRKPLNFTQKLIRLSGINPYHAEDALAPRGMSKFSFHRDENLQAVIPSANGVFTANSLAKMYAMLANQGQWQGQQIIQQHVFNELSCIQSYARDRVIAMPMHWRLGYHRIFTLGKRVPMAFGHIGYNGSGAWCDPSRQLSFAYIHNLSSGSLIGDYRLWWLNQVALQCADRALKGHKSWF